MRIVTYNVHKCRGIDGRSSALRIAEVLCEIAPDIIALQEVLDHQAETISAELKLPYVLGENRKHRGYGYGNVVLSRFPIRTMRNYDLSVRGREERGCLRADLDGERRHPAARVQRSPGDGTVGAAGPGAETDRAGAAERRGNRVAPHRPGRLQ